MTARPRSAVTTEIEDIGVVAVIRLKDPGKLRGVVDALAEGGARALEVTMTVPRAIELIAEIAPTLPPGFLCGVGTVVDAATARRAIEAGAQFVVSPVFRPEVIAECHRQNVPSVPGCMTPTEILAAWDLGADIVKVFPATALGPGFVKDIRGPMPQVKLMPTGGVSINNAGDWIRAGASAVGVGTALLDARAIEAGNFGPIVDNARRIMGNVRAAREARP
jgi:2-dehydro-3-deoxyphosphogluconate aldolase / (4S)-4-hydroxy-2-oxoglutarate aldolase